MSEEQGNPRDLVSGRYAIERELGRGGSATVFLSHDMQEGRPVALKLLHQEFSGSRSAERFAQEIRLLREFDHPGILTVTDAGEWQGRPFYVMPYVDGESLQDRLRRERRLPFDEVTRIGQRLCEALAYAHAQKVVHRDVKPANVMLSGDAVYLTDFGIAKALEPVGESPHSTTGVARGTRAYMSPEQATADRDLDHRSDIFSLGCVLYEMIAGQNPYQSADESRMLMRRITDDPDPLRRHRDGVPAGLERAVMKALAREPADRWQGVGEMGEHVSSSSERIEPRLRDIIARRPLTRVGVIVIAVGLAVLASRSRSNGFSAPASNDAETIPVRLVVERQGPFEADSLTERIAREIQQGLERATVRWFDAEWTVRDHASSGDIDTPPLARDNGDTRGSAEGRRPRNDPLTIRWIVERSNDSVRMTAALYDPSKTGSTRRVSMNWASAADVTPLRLVQQLLRPESLDLRERWSDTTTGSLRAWQQFAEGYSAVAEGDLQAADSLLSLAVRTDPAYTEAWRYLTLTRLWQARSAGDAAAAAAEGLFVAYSRGGGRPDALDSALALTSRAQFHEARAHLARITPPRSDSGVLAVLLGHVHAWDSTITVESGGPQYEGSFWYAAQQYSDAIALGDRAIAAAAFASLASVRFAEATRVRIGYLEGAARQAMVAYPTLEGDTVAFRPMTLTEMASGPSEPVLRARNLAVCLNQELLERTATTWTRRYPEDPRAWEALALAAESSGEIEEAITASASASAALARALALERGERSRARLTVHQLRLHLKAHRWTDAMRLSDSLLGAEPVESPERAGMLAPVAALVGRTDDAIALLARSGTDFSLERDNVVRLRVPASLRTDAAEAFVLAAAGACGQRLSHAMTRVETGISRLVSAAEAPQMRSLLLDWSISLAVPCADTPGVERLDPRGDQLIIGQQLLRRGDSAGVRMHLLSLDRRRKYARPGDVAPDVAFQEAWMLLALGDSLEAERRLERIFESLPTAGIALTTEVTQAATLLRAARQLEALAERASDGDKRRKWQQVVHGLTTSEPKRSMS